MPQNQPGPTRDLLLLVSAARRYVDSVARLPDGPNAKGTDAVTDLVRVVGRAESTFVDAAPSERPVRGAPSQLLSSRALPTTAIADVGTVLGGGGWNYRVFQRHVLTAEGSESESFVGEAYYDPKGQVVGWTGPVDVIGSDDAESVREELWQMMKALDQPPLDYDAKPSPRVRS